MSNIQVAQDFFQHYLPQSIRPLVDLNSLKLSPNSYVDQNLKLSNSDVLYKATIANEPGYLYILCEHQSSVDRLMPFRLWQYITKIWQDHINQTQTQILPLVIPLVFYHGEMPYSGPRDLRDLIQAPKALIEDALFKSFHLIDTHDIHDETLREQRWAGVMAFTMKHIFARDFMVYIQPFLDMISALEQQEGSTPYVVSLLNYLISEGEINETAVFVEKLETELSNSKRGDKMKIADWLREQGREQGQADLLLRQIQRKFGTVASDYQDRVLNANSDQLLLWGERLLDTPSPEALFGE